MSIDLNVIMNETQSYWLNLLFKRNYKLSRFMKITILSHTTIYTEIQFTIRSQDSLNPIPSARNISHSGKYSVSFFYVSLCLIFDEAAVLSVE